LSNNGQHQDDFVKVKQTRFGTTPTGSNISLFSLDNGQGLTMAVTDFGATLCSLHFPDKAGHLDNIVLGYDSFEDLLADSNYFGATIGRYANRIANGQFEIDGETFQLTQNEDANHLHGGEVGFNKKRWDILVANEDSITFHLSSAAGEQGYPGNLSVSLSYRLTAANELIIDYTAKTDAACPVNLTNHSYWNLAGSGDILAHRLTLECPRYLPVTEALLPTGEIASVANSAFDFISAATIGARINAVAGGYDHCFVRSDKVTGEPKLIARVEDPLSGRIMTMATTEPSIQFYTGNFLDNVQGADGNTYGKHSGFCLEAQHYPDSPNQPSFPNTLLRPDEVYKQTTIHRFSQAGES
jgi:aldose 1-epimerase